MDASLRLKLDGSQFIPTGRQSIKTVADLRAETARFQSTAASSGATISSLRSQVVGLAAGYLSLRTAYAAFTFIVSKASAFQQLRLQLETVLGSADAAEAAFAKIRSFATSTPFEVENITSAFINLAGVGLNPTIDMLNDLGQVAAARGRDITDFSQAVVNATVGEMEMLKSFGIVARVEGDKIKFHFKGATTEVGRNATAIVEHLRSIGRENFAGGMERQAKSLGGAFSNLQDGAAAFADEVGQAGLLDAITELTLVLVSASGEAGGLAQSLGQVLGTAVRGLAALLEFLTTNAWAFHAAVIAIAAATGGPLVAALAAVSVAYFDYASGVNASYKAELELLAISSDSREVLEMLIAKTAELTDEEWARVEAIKATMEAEIERQKAFIVGRTKEYNDRRNLPGRGAFDVIGALSEKLTGIENTDFGTRIAREVRDAQGVIREMEQGLARIDDRLAGRNRPPTKPADGADDDKKIAAARQRLALIEEDIRLQKELQALYREGPGVDIADRLRRETEINDAHERRADAIRNETALGKELIAATAGRLKSEEAIKEAMVERGAILRQEERLTGILQKSTEDLAKAISDSFAANNAALDQLIAKLERAAEITDEMATDEERRMRAVAEVNAFYDRGLISRETRDRVGRANAEPLFTPDQQAMRDFVDETIASFMTIRERAQAEMALIERAFADHADDAEMMVVMERALSEARGRASLEELSRLEGHLQAWGSFFDFLGDRLGTAGQQAAQFINTILSAIQTGKQVGGAISNAAGAAAIGGWAGAIVGIAIAAYDLLESRQAARRAQNYQIGAVVTSDNGRWNEMGLEGQSRQLSNQIMRTAEAFAEAIGGVIRDFADLEIHIRRDGKYFQAFVEGELIGKFETVNDAVTAALRAALLHAETSITGLSELVQQGLSQLVSTTSPTNLDLDEIQEFLVALREISELSLSSGALQLRETLNGLDKLRAALERLTAITPAVTQGLNDLRQEEISAWQAWRRSITGERETPQQQLARQQAEARMFNAEKAARIAELKLRKLELEARLVDLRGQAEIARGSGRVREADLRGGVIYVEARAKLAEAEINIHQQEIDALVAYIEALGKLIDEIAAIADIDIDKIKLPRTGGGQDRADSQAAWRDRYLTVGMQEAERGAYDLTRSLADMRREAAELKIPLDQQAEAERRLTEEYRRGVQARAESLAGRRGQWDDRLKEVEDFFAGLEAAGRQTTGIPDWRRRLLEDESVQRVGQEAVASLGGAAAQFLQTLTGIMDTLAFIEANAEKFKLTEQDIANLRAATQEQTFLGLADQMARYITDESEKRRLAELRFDLEKGQMLVMIELAHEMKAITDAQYAELRRLHGLLPENLPEGGAVDDGTRFRGYEDAQQAAATQSSAAQQFASAVEQFERSTQSLIEAYVGTFGADRELGYGGERGLDILQQRYRDILGRADQGDIEARNQFSGIARDLLGYLNDFNAGGSYFAAERERIRTDWERLIGATTFQVPNAAPNVVSSNLFTPQPAPSVPVGGVGNAGIVSNEAIQLLREIGQAVMRNQTATVPLLAAIANATSGNGVDLERLTAALERLLALIKERNAA